MDIARTEANFGEIARLRYERRLSTTLHLNSAMQTLLHAALQRLKDIDERLHREAA